MELERLGKYELLNRLGQGGMGEVWKARDTQLRRYVAIKILHPNLQENPDFVTHFMREARFVASLQHPNIVQIHDFQLTDIQGSGVTAYMVMDYVEGGTLADYIRATSRKGLFPPAEDIVYLFTAISLALDYAHQKGMVHRDIKPANILLDKRATTSKPMGEPILTDFGIAKLQGGGAATLTHTAIGTPLYISPEQAKGQVATERSDLYSLGVILYEIVTGITPFRGNNPIAIMMQHVNEMPTPPTLINPNVSPALSEVVLRSIAKDPAARFPTASALTVTLAQALGVRVPSSLSKPTSIKDQPDYNPLQPSRSLSGMAPHLPILTASPAVPFTPEMADVARPYPQAGAQLNSPTSLTPAKDDRTLQSPLPPSSPLPPKQPRGRSRGLYNALIACVLLVLVGLGAYFVLPLLLPKNTPAVQNSSGSVVGHITFMHSSSAPSNTFDQLQITLNKIPSLPAGKTYYAWLENANSEVSDPFWELPFSNGNVNYLTPVDTSRPDLVDHNITFLVTAQDAGTALNIPLLDLTTHRYYAIISPPSSSFPTLVVRQCPSSSTNNGANPCR
jgi:serine/threonine protein kinase